MTLEPIALEEAAAGVQAEPEVEDSRRKQHQATEALVVVVRREADPAQRLQGALGMGDEDEQRQHTTARRQDTRQPPVGRHADMIKLALSAPVASGGRAVAAPLGS